MPTQLSRELVFLILQFLDEEKLTETAHKLEQESGLFFNMEYFEGEVLNGNWDEVERYLSGFTKVEDNRYSLKIFLEIRKLKYYEALDRHDRVEAVDILVKDLKVFASYNEELFKEITQLLSLENLRENELLSTYGDTKSARMKVLVELKKLIEANPLFCGKLQFPSFKNARLRTLLNQSLNWQHHRCRNTKINPEIKTLFVDNLCGQPADNPPLGSIQKAGNFPSTAAHEANLPASTLAVTYPQNDSQATYGPDELPRTVARTLNQGSIPTSMDFHPIQQTILLVGTNVGDIGLWDVGSAERLALKTLQIGLIIDLGNSVNRILWSPDGSVFGVAYSRGILQMYSYHGGDDIRQYLESCANGGINDLAFALLNKQLCVITCGDDKKIHVRDAISGTKLYTFEGHESPVYSVCPRYKDNIQFIYSTSLDGKVKVWECDNLESGVDFDAPGYCCTTMAYSADVSRLFSCATGKEGESYIVEWNESEGTVKRRYQGFQKQSSGAVQFDTTRNRFLAAGDEFLIKFWDMDNTNLLTTIDAEGGLPESPRIRFNKEGTLLAVSTHDNGIKILANADGLRLLLAFENRSFDTSRVLETVTKNGDAINMVNYKLLYLGESMDKSKTWKLPEIYEPAQIRSLRITNNLKTSKICRLAYTNSGSAILALGANAIHHIWRWPHNEHNPSVKATAPQLWRPPSGILMTNETTNTNPEDEFACFALSKNNCYLMSASGEKISLFNMMNFMTMTTFKPPMAAPATFLAFNPLDNNIVAIGNDDGMIYIYNIRADEVTNELIGHSGKITGLAFSYVLNVLITSGGDSQICVWGTDRWEKQRRKQLKIPTFGEVYMADTFVQFHQDQIHFLAVHRTQIAIYGATKLECVMQWVPPILSAYYGLIAYATFSCDCRWIYVSFIDATVCVVSAADLVPRCRINPAAYLPAQISPSVYPAVIAAHPCQPNQFALGLKDGSIHLLEPLESGGDWGVDPPSENGSVSGMYIEDSERIGELIRRLGIGR